MFEKIICAFYRKMDCTLEKSRAAYPYMEPNNLERIFDVPYCADDNPAHTFDFYRPLNSAKKLPVIVDIHGGGWFAGKKETNRSFCLELARQGYGVFCPNYTLAPLADISVQMRELFSFLNWLESNSDEYNCDLSNVFLCGDSAGGQLAGMVLNALHNNRMCDYFGVSSRIDIKGACFICGAMNIGTMSKKPFFSLFFRYVLGKGYKKSKIIDYVEFIKNISLECCPVLLISSKEDMLKKETFITKKVLDRLNIPCEVFFWGKAHVEKRKLTHVFNVLYPSWEESVISNEKIGAFFSRLNATR